MSQGARRAMAPRHPRDRKGIRMAGQRRFGIELDRDMGGWRRSPISTMGALIALGHKKAILMILVIALAVAPTAAAAKNDPLVGGWRSTDVDGSALAWFIEESVDGTYLVEGYDHGAGVCGSPGSRSPGVSEGVPTEPARYGLGYAWIDDTGALSLDNADIICLDPVLGPYRVMKSDFDPDTPEEEDGPVLGPKQLTYDPETDTLIDDIGPEFDPLVFERMKATTVKEFRKEVAKAP